MTRPYAVKAVEVLASGPGVLVRAFVFAPGEATPWHRHTAVRDLAICVTGAITVETRDPPAVRVLDPGDRAETPAGAAHRLVNAGGVDAQVLLIQDGGAYDFRVEPA
ncbi:cupin domain-containing protein [Caulobacter sp. KR2-114]|uniref:cupin domain-containing protein n=1 Tax=Caulobacter sp. KR2-114 TaxID=3400912 RepID=UPI003C0C9A6F